MQFREKSAAYNRVYRQRHREDINKRRRESRRQKRQQHLQQMNTVSNVQNTDQIEQTAQAISHNQLNLNSHTQTTQEMDDIIQIQNDPDSSNLKIIIPARY